jgi:hypothetical protein
VEEGDKAMPGDESACKTSEMDSKAETEGEKEEGTKAAAIVAREVAPDEPAKSVEGEVMEVKAEGEGERAPFV